MLNFKNRVIFLHPNSIVGMVSAQPQGQVITLTAMNADTYDETAITLYLPVNVTPGIYNMSYATDVDVAFWYQMGSTAAIYNLVFSPSSPSVTVTSHNPTTKNIKGTFNNVTVYKTDGSNSTKTLTNGNFDVTYQ